MSRLILKKQTPSRDYTRRQWVWQLSPKSDLGGLFAEKLDEIGKTYILLRRPRTTHIENRLKHAVAYLIAELPVLLMGFCHQGQHYCTLIYPTTPQKAAAWMEANCLWDFLYEILSFPEFAELKHQLFGITETENIHGTILLPIPDMTEWTYC